MADVVARVVAWHNRHPLARRIGPEDVGAVGIVSLPFAVTETAAGAAAVRTAAPLFDGRWLYRARSTDLGRWVRRHGAYPLPACAGWPARQIDADLALSRQADRHGQTGRTLRHVILATVERGGHQIRVLIAPGRPARRAAVWGPRLWSAPRSALAGVLVLAAFGWALLPALPWQAETPGVPAAMLAQGTAGAATGAPAAVTVASGTVSDAAATADPIVATAPGHAAAGPADASPPAARAHDQHAPVASPTGSPAPPGAAADPGGPLATAEASDALQAPKPVDVPVRLWDARSGEPPLVSIRPRLSDDTQRHARVEAATLRQAQAATKPEAAALDGPVYALVTRATRQREDAQGQQVLLQGLQAQAATGRPTRVELMARGGRWQVVWWPLPDRRRAEDLLVEARARGLKVEIVSF